MKTSTIDATCGIYETVYTVRDYGSKVVVSAPYIRWSNNSGNLDFWMATVTKPDKLALLRTMAENNKLFADDGDGATMIEDVIGYCNGK